MRMGRSRQALFSEFDAQIQAMKAAFEQSAQLLKGGPRLVSAGSHEPSAVPSSTGGGGLDLAGALLATAAALRAKECRMEAGGTGADEGDTQEAHSALQMLQQQFELQQSQQQQLTERTIKNLSAHWE